MEKNEWNNIKEFLLENDYEFTHTESEEEFLLESSKVEKVGIMSIADEISQNSKCRAWRPIKRRICREVDGKYKCITHVTYKCVK